MDLTGRLKHWDAAARRNRVGLMLIFALNLLVIVALGWSKDGQTAVIEVSNQGKLYEATIDGRKLPGKFELDVPPTGTVWLELAPALPSLPKPSGIDSIEIRERGSGRLLFRDDFDSLRPNVWEVKEGAFKVDDGVLTALNQTTVNNLVLDNRNWTDATVRDYTVSVTYRNGVGGTIGSHVVPGGGAFYSFELIRDFPTFFDARIDNKQTSYQHADSVYVQPAADGTLKSVVYMLTRPYPYVVAALGMGLLLVGVLSFLPVRLNPLPRREGTWLAKVGAVVRPAGPGSLAAGAIVIVAFVATLVLHLEYYRALPHVPDEVAYLFQAKLLAAGHVMGQKPPVTWAFDFYELPFMYVRGEQWASFYPFGHPLVLAVGERVGLVWLVPSVVGAACVGLVYAIGKRFYGTTTALLAGVLMVTSPLFLMQASNFMSHNTTALLVLLCLWFLLKRERPLLYGLIAGLVFGLAVNTRPATAIAMAPAFGIVMLAYLWLPDTRRAAIRHTGGFIAGALVGAIALLGYNYGLTGDPFTSAYSDNPAATIGFNNGHTIETGMRNQQAQMASLLLVFTGWPMFVGLAFVGLPFLIGTRNKWDYFCLLCALSLMGVYLLYRYSGVFEGPRYWYEAMPFLYLLSSRGVMVAIEFLARMVGLARSQAFGPQAPPRFAAGLVVSGALALLLVYGTGGWLTGADRGWDVWNAHLIPNSPDAMRQLFGVDDRLLKVADETELHNALVLVEPCGWFRSANCYGSVFVKNDIHFKGDVIWARYVAGYEDQVIAAFPGRTVYVATWDEGATIKPYVKSAPSGAGR